MVASLRISLILFVLFTLVFGLAYTGLSTVLIQSIFPQQAQGSLLSKEGQIEGSNLIGQNFSKPEYFWGRLSATSPFAYNAASSSGSNLGVNNPALQDNVRARLAALKQADPSNTSPVPVDLVTASGSGLDPHISPDAAAYQLERVAHARNLAPEAVSRLVQQFTEGRQFGILGEPRVNVLQLNVALDGR